jgi:hypothetical protein
MGNNTEKSSGDSSVEVINTPEEVFRAAKDELAEAHFELTTTRYPDRSDWRQREITADQREANLEAAERRVTAAREAFDKATDDPAVAAEWVRVAERNVDEWSRAAAGGSVSITDGSWKRAHLSICNDELRRADEKLAKVSGNS